MQDVTTVEYREHDRGPAVMRVRGFPIYRTLFAIQLIAIGVIYATAAGWIN